VPALAQASGQKPEPEPPPRAPTFPRRTSPRREPAPAVSAAQISNKREATSSFLPLWIRAIRQNCTPRPRFYVPSFHARLFASIRGSPTIRITNRSSQAPSKNRSKPPHIFLEKCSEIYKSFFQDTTDCGSISPHATTSCGYTRRSTGFHRQIARYSQEIRSPRGLIPKLLTIRAP